MSSKLLTFIFFSSGFAALIYQVAWQRLLTLYWGVGSISTTIIVSVYMLGLGLGALIGGRLAEQVKHKILCYFFVELAIGVFGIISIPFLELLGYHAAGISYSLSLGIIFLFLCLPTMLMGITLPLVIKIFNQILRDFIHTISFLYFVNTLGAAAGSVFSSFILITFFGLDSAVVFAAGLNFILAFLIWCLAKKRPQKLIKAEEHIASQDSPKPNEFLGKVALVLVLISGFLAIGYEIIWFRLISILTKSSPYNFSSVLGIYLLGIALGSYGMKKYLDKQLNLNRKVMFFTLQMGIAGSVWILIVAYYYLTLNTPLKVFTNISFNSELHPPLALLNFDTWQPSLFAKTLFTLFHAADFIFWPLYFVFIPTLLMGASFPLIAFLAFTKKGQDAMTVAEVYFFNILGNVLGGVVTGFILLPLLGTERTLLVFIVIGLLMGSVMIIRERRMGAWIKNGVFIISTLVVMISVFPARSDLYKIIYQTSCRGLNVFFEEGVEGVVYAEGEAENLINYIDGLSHGWRPAIHFYHKASEAVSYTHKQEKVLVIGYGTGTTSEILLDIPFVKKITVVEINRTLIKNLVKIPFFTDMLSDPRLELVIDDARRFLLRDHTRYDLVMMDPLRATTFYSNNLYSAEFFQLIQQHLTPEGIVLIWFDEHHVIPKTIATIFPYVRQYGSFCLASSQPFEQNVQLRERILALYPPYMRNRILGFEQISAGHEAGKYLGDEQYIRYKTQQYRINQDYKPVTEYYLRDGKKLLSH